MTHLAEPFADATAVAINGAQLACREQGAGESVVLVHGSASDLRTWSAQLPALSDAYRVLASSRRYARARSPRLFHVLAAGFRELLPRTESVEIEGASHLVHEDRPATTNAAIRSFLEHATRPAAS